MCASASGIGLAVRLDRRAGDTVKRDDRLLGRRELGRRRDVAAPLGLAWSPGPADTASSACRAAAIRVRAAAISARKADARSRKSSVASAGGGSRFSGMLMISSYNAHTVRSNAHQNLGDGNDEISPRRAGQRE